MSLAIILATNTASAAATHNSTVSVNKHIAASSLGNTRDVLNNRTNEHFSTIQAAINSANTLNGDSIVVEEGTYKENVMVNKSLNLLAHGTAIIDPDYANDYCFNITPEGAGSLIQGFTMNGRPGFIVEGNKCVVDSNKVDRGTIGIDVQADGCTVSNNILTSCGTGISCNGDECTLIGNKISNSEDSGIYAIKSKNLKVLENQIMDSEYGTGINFQIISGSTVKENVVSQNNAGLFLNGFDEGGSYNNLIADNYISNNNIGLVLQNSQNNTLMNNRFMDNTHNLNIQSTHIRCYVQNIDTSNSMNGKPIYYIVGNTQELSIDGKDPKYASGIGYLGLVLCSNVLVKNVHITNNGQGILFAGTSSSIIQNCNLEDNIDGIALVSTLNNWIENNNLSNDVNGIFLGASTNTLVVENIIKNCTGFGIIAQYGTNRYTGNELYNNENGIKLLLSPNNLLESNIIKNSDSEGLILIGSPNNVIKNTVLNNNKINLDVDISSIGNMVQDIDTTNKINNKPVYYLVGNSDININGKDPAYSKGIGYLSLINCYNVKVQNVSINDNGQGILVAATSNGLIENCKFNDNINGLVLLQCHNITILKNSLSNCQGNPMSSTGNGIYVDGYSTKNSIQQNQITKNNGYGIYIDNKKVKSVNNSITGNNLSENVGGILLSNTTGNTVKTNQIIRNKVGVNLQKGENNIITENNISNNTAVGIYTNNPGNNIIQFNSIINNTLALENENLTVSAPYNWWGTNKPDFSSIIKGKFNKVPFMVLTLTANPNTVLLNNNVSIKADLLHDNMGTYHDPKNGLVPYAGSAHFNSTLGTIKNVNFDKGEAKSVLTKLNTPGTALVTTRVDEQNITVKVNVKSLKTVTFGQLALAAGSIKKYYETKSTLPKMVNVHGQYFTMAQFLTMINTGIVNINSGNTSPVPVLLDVNPATKTISSKIKGTILKGDYVKTASKLQNYIQLNHKTPEYIKTSIGKISFDKLVYLFSQVIYQYQSKHTLPKQITMR